MIPKQLLIKSINECKHIDNINEIVESACMSEKRFTVRRDEKRAILIPNSILKDGEIIDEEEVVDLLNELSEEKQYFERKKEYFLHKWSIANAENIQLRQENRKLKKEIDNCKNDYRELFSKYVALDEENEQLKLKNERILRII